MRATSGRHRSTATPTHTIVHMCTWIITVELRTGNSSKHPGQRSHVVFGIERLRQMLQNLPHILHVSTLIDVALITPIKESSCFAGSSINEALFARYAMSRRCVMQE